MNNEAIIKLKIKIKIFYIFFAIFYVFYIYLKVIHYIIIIL